MFGLFWGLWFSLSPAAAWPNFGIQTGVGMSDLIERWIWTPYGMHPDEGQSKHMTRYAIADSREENNVLDALEANFERLRAVVHVAGYRTPAAG